MYRREKGEGLEKREIYKWKDQRKTGCTRRWNNSLPNSFLNNVAINTRNIVLNIVFRFWNAVVNSISNCDSVPMNPGKMVPKKWSPKNDPRKNGPRKNGPREEWSPENRSSEKWFPENWSPGNLETKNRGESIEHRGVCVECLDVINLWKPKTRKQTQSLGTKNRGVSVEHRGVCVGCSDVINLWKPKTWQQTFLDSFRVLQFRAYVGSWRKR